MISLSFVCLGKSVSPSQLCWIKYSCLAVCFLGTLRIGHSILSWISGSLPRFGTVLVAITLYIYNCYYFKSIPFILFFSFWTLIILVYVLDCCPIDHEFFLINSFPLFPLTGLFQNSYPLVHSFCLPITILYCTCSLVLFHFIH